MKRRAEVTEKRCLLERDRGWIEALEWWVRRQPSAEEVREVLLRASEWNPADHGARLYKYGRIEACEWLLEEGPIHAPTTRGMFPPPPRPSRTHARPPRLPRWRFRK